MTPAPRRRAAPPCLAALGVLALAAAPAQAQTRTDAGVAEAEEAPSRSPFALQLSLQSWLLGASDYSVSVADAELATSTGVGVGIGAELLVSDVFGAGVTATFVRRPSDDPYLSDTLLTHLGVELGPRWFVSDSLLLGLSALAGFQVLTFRDAEEEVLGLGVGATGLIALHITEVVWLEVQLGALAQPVGGHEATDFTFKPTPLGTIGFSLLLPPRR